MKNQNYVSFANSNNKYLVSLALALALALAFANNKYLVSCVYKYF